MRRLSGAGHMTDGQQRISTACVGLVELRTLTPVEEIPIVWGTLVFRGSCFGVLVFAGSIAERELAVTSMAWVIATRLRP